MNFPTTAGEATKEIQRIALAKPDGDPGSETNGALSRLFALAKKSPDAVWPPVTVPAELVAFAGLTPELRAEYRRLWDSMQFRWEDDHTDEPRLEAIYQGLKVEYGITVAAMKKNRPRYQSIASAAGGSIPWWFVALLHNMECGLSFAKHLHNGDPLTVRTVQVPAGRPAKGSAPFTFEESAVDALTMPGKAYHEVTDWSLEATLYRLEGFNGYGYRKFHKTVLSPYVWSGSNHYTQGKYVADRVWSDTAVSKQLGTALLLRALLAA